MNFLDKITKKATETFQFTKEKTSKRYGKIISYLF